MLKKIRITLASLEAQLQELWLDYITNKPAPWLMHRRSASKQCTEMQNVLGTVRAIQRNIDNIYVLLESTTFAPLREKEN